MSLACMAETRDLDSAMTCLPSPCAHTIDSRPSLSSRRLPLPAIDRCPRPGPVYYIKHSHTPPQRHRHHSLALIRNLPKQSMRTHCLIFSLPCPRVLDNVTWRNFRVINGLVMLDSLAFKQANITFGPWHEL